MNPPFPGSRVPPPPPRLSSPGFPAHQPPPFAPPPPPGSASNAAARSSSPTPQFPVGSFSSPLSSLNYSSQAPANPPPLPPPHNRPPPPANGVVRPGSVKSPATLPHGFSLNDAASFNKTNGNSFKAPPPPPTSVSNAAFYAPEPENGLGLGHLRKVSGVPDGVLSQISNVPPPPFDGSGPSAFNRRATTGSSPHAPPPQPHQSPAIPSFQPPPTFSPPPPPSNRIPEVVSSSSSSNVFSPGGGRSSMKNPPLPPPMHQPAESTPIEKAGSSVPLSSRRKSAAPGVIMAPAPPPVHIPPPTKAPEPTGPLSDFAVAAQEALAFHARRASHGGGVLESASKVAAQAAAAQSSSPPSAPPMHRRNPSQVAPPPPPAQRPPPPSNQHAPPAPPLHAVNVPQAPPMHSPPPAPGLRASSPQFGAIPPSSAPKPPPFMQPPAAPQPPPMAPAAPIPQAPAPPSQPYWGQRKPSLGHGLVPAIAPPIPASHSSPPAAPFSPPAPQPPSVPTAPPLPTTSYQSQPSGSGYMSNSIYGKRRMSLRSGFYSQVGSNMDDVDEQEKNENEKEKPSKPKPPPPPSDTLPFGPPPPPPDSQSQSAAQSGADSARYFTVNSRNQSQNRAMVQNFFKPPPPPDTDQSAFSLGQTVKVVDYHKPQAQPPQLPQPAQQTQTQSQLRPTHSRSLSQNQNQNQNSNQMMNQARPPPVQIPQQNSRWRYVDLFRDPSFVADIPHIGPEPYPLYPDWLDEWMRLPESEWEDLSAPSTPGDGSKEFRPRSWMMLEDRGRQVPYWGDDGTIVPVLTEEAIYRHNLMFSQDQQQQQ